MYFAPIDAHLDCVTVAVLTHSARSRSRPQFAMREPGQLVFVTTCVIAPGLTA